MPWKIILSLFQWKSTLAKFILMLLKVSGKLHCFDVERWKKGFLQSSSWKTLQIFWFIPVYFTFNLFINFYEFLCHIKFQCLYWETNSAWVLWKHNRVVWKCIGITGMFTVKVSSSIWKPLIFCMILNHLCSSYSAMLHTLRDICVVIMLSTASLGTSQ